MKSRRGWRGPEAGAAGEGGAGAALEIWTSESSSSGARIMVEVKHSKTLLPDEQNRELKPCSRERLRLPRNRIAEAGVPAARIMTAQIWQSLQFLA